MKLVYVAEITTSVGLAMKKHKPAVPFQRLFIKIIMIIIIYYGANFVSKGVTYFRLVE